MVVVTMVAVVVVLVAIIIVLVKQRAKSVIRITHQVDVIYP